MTSTIFRRLPDDPSRVVKPRPDWTTFGWAYRTSAELLAKASVESLEPSSVLAFPIVFLYRHSVEMYLKGILIDFGSDLKITQKAVIDRGHSLDGHLSDVKKLAETVGITLTSECIQTIGELQYFDPASMTFRYPENKGGSALISDDRFTVNVQRLTSAAGSALDELDDLHQRLVQDRYDDILDAEGIPR